MMRINKSIFPLALLAFLAMLASCSGGGSAANPGIHEPTGDYEISKSEQDRDRSPNVATADFDELVAENTQFALDIYNQIKDEHDNIFYSPYSISVALAMTYSGARNNTETEMADAMNFTLPQSELHPAFNKLDLDLNSRGKNVEEGKKFVLNIVNSIWGEKTWVFLPDFLDTLAVNYDAGLRLVDFVGAQDASRVVINDWVETMTRDRIKDLIKDGMVDESTVLVLVNAIYFKAQWKTAFEETLTKPGDFHLLDGGTVSATTMSQEESFGYLDGDGFTAVALPYTGDEMSMLIVLPDEGKFEEVESSLDSAMLGSITDGIHNAYIQLDMPKFEYDMDFELADALKGMGMIDAFEPGIADFSGMDGSLLLYIMWIIHQAFVSVDEAGTEAAAATAVGIGMVSAPQIEAVVKVDRPFIFMIRDDISGTILFMGRVLDPS